MTIIDFNCKELVKRHDILSSTGIAIGVLIAGSCCVSEHAVSAEHNSDPYLHKSMTWLTLLLLGLVFQVLQQRAD